MSQSIYDLPSIGIRQKMPVQAMQNDQPDQGTLQVVALTEQNLPIADATVDISYTGEPNQTLEEVRTDQMGQTEELTLAAPPLEYSLSPSENQPYSEYTISVTAPGYETITVTGS